MNLHEYMTRRADPDSIEAYYEVEMPNIHVDVGVDDFVWDRYKSNENINDHLFSHYLTRRLYDSEFIVTDGQKIGKDIVNIRTDDGNTALLCGNFEYDSDDDYPERLILIVQQEALDNGLIRLITAYETDKRQYLQWYWKAFNARKMKREHTFVIPQRPPHIQELWEKRYREIDEIQHEEYDAFLEALINGSIRAAAKFQLDVANDRMNW